jgi:hypothetical protein
MDFTNCKTCNRVIFTHDADADGNCVGCAKPKAPKYPVGVPKAAPKPEPKPEDEKA